MFSSPIYKQIATSGDEYRNMSFSVLNLLKTAKENYEIFSLYAIRKEVALLIIISFVSILLIWIKERENVKKISIKLIIILVTTPIYAYITSTVINSNLNMKSLLNILVDALIWSTYLVNIVYIVYKYIDNVSCRNRIIFFGTSALISVSPMFFVQPLGARCFYISHIFIVCVIINVLIYIDDETGWIENSIVRIIVRIVAISVSITYLYIFTRIGYVDAVETKYIEQNIKNIKKEIVLPKYPFEDYIHYPYTEDKIEYYKTYYNTSDEIKAKYVDYSEWMSNLKK